MRIQFHEAERDAVRYELIDAEMDASDVIVDSILKDIASAFDQQFSSEVQYFVLARMDAMERAGKGTQS